MAVPTASATRAPSAAPVASAGVSRPPVAPARRNAIVSSGLRINSAAAAATLRLRSTLTRRTLAPLPGSSGNRCEQMPTASPAAATAGITRQVPAVPRVIARARAASVSRRNTSPTAAVAGASSIATAIKR